MGAAACRWWTECIEKRTRHIKLLLDFLERKSLGSICKIKGKDNPIFKDVNRIYKIVNQLAPLGYVFQVKTPELIYVHRDFFPGQRGVFYFFF